ncbi:complement regulator-acquiring protein [Borreliella andersonii]|uniref:complement regulator-acquiring protein n=1 Tax=Borrelia andersonii TaxID=42109 RepID=UPI003AB7C834
MKNPKLNIIKLNVITAILTLICISCAPFEKVNPNKIKNPNASRSLKKPKRSNNSRNLTETNSHINSENSAQNNQNPENESQNSKSSNQNPENESQNSKSSNQNPENESQNSKSSNQNPENESQNSKSSNQNPQEETTIPKLENIAKDLKAQEKEEDTQIAKINGTQYDFLETFNIDPYFMHNAKMRLKRIIYPSLNYDTEKILALKEILEKLAKNPKTRIIAYKFLETSRNIQNQHEDTLLKKIQDNLRTGSKEEVEELLKHVERDLKIKQNFVKSLNATIEAYNKNLGNIKTDNEALANHIKEKYYYTMNLLNQAD